MNARRIVTWLQQLPIRTRLVGLVAAALLPAFAIALSHLGTQAELARDGARQQARLLTTHTTAALETALRDAGTLLATLARRPLVSALAPGACDAGFDDVVALDPVYLSLSLRRADGSSVCSSGPAGTAPVAGAAWFGTALAAGQPAVSDGVLDPQDGRWTVVKTHPLPGPERAAAGLLTLVLDLAALSARAVALAPAAGIVTVTDRQWQVLLRRPDQERQVGQPIPQRFVARLSGAAEGAFQEEGIDGQLRLYAFQSLPRTGWRVLASLPREAVLADYRRSSTLAAGAMALALAGGVTLALLLAGSIIGPVRRLSEVAQRVAAGDASRRATPTGPRELAAVATQFNRMLDVQVENEERFRALTALSSDWYWEQDREFRFVTIAPRVGEIVDLPAGEHLGKRRWELGDVGLTDAQMRQHRDQLERHEPFRDLVLRRRGRDSRPRIVSLSGEPVFDGDGNFSGYRGIGRDITAQHLAEAEVRAREAQYRTLIEHLSAGVVVHAPDTAVLMANRAAAQLLGLSPAQMLGRTAADPAWRFVREDGTPMPVDEYPVVRVQATGEPVVDLVAGVEHGAGRTWVIARAFPEFDEQRRLTRIIVTFSDITALKKAEVLRAEKEAVELAGRSQSEFLSRVSHELRTPLNSILGFGQLLQVDPALAGAPATRERVDHVVTAGRHLLAMVNDILDVTRAEAGALTLHTEVVDLVHTVRECAALVQPQAARRAIVLEAAAEPGCWQVRGDPNRLRQILMNLMSNAVKYNAEGGQISVRVAGDAARARVSVTDTGPGLAPAQRAALFQPFNRLGAERTGTEGTGLGLVIARLLAQAMGGEIEIDSQPGAGSTFSLVLPRLDSADADADLAAAPPAVAHAAAHPPPAAGRAAGGRLLYVEDNPASALLLQQAITLLPDVALTMAHDGLAGLDLARREQPDLILLDLGLPLLDGFGVLRRLQADPVLARIPCIALTANAMPGDEARVRAAGFVDYLTKPYDIELLLARISHWLARARG